MNNNGGILGNSKYETILETIRALLEPLHPGHAKFLFKDLLDPNLYLFIPQNPPGSLDELKARYTILSKRLSPDGKEIWLNWAIRRKNDNSFLGLLEASLDDSEVAEIAYFIFPRYWKQGYAKETCAQMNKFIFENFEVSIIRALIDTRNHASIALIESLGFKKISLNREADSFKGYVSDEYCYELRKMSPRV